MNIHMIASALAPHSPIGVLAVDTNDLQPVGQLDIATPLIVAAALAVPCRALARARNGDGAFGG